MFSLPHEVQFDVLKCFDFNQLFSVKQTNLYLFNLINKYEGELARIKLHGISLLSNKPDSFNKIIEPQSVTVEFTLNDKLKQKWKTAIDKLIPLFLNEPGRKLFLYIETIVDKTYLLKLPIIPKNIEVMIIVRCWLEQLFRCAFECCNFIRGLFNPEMINILFDNDKQIPLQFNIQKANIWAVNTTIENVLKFSLNHLLISEFLNIQMDQVDITEKYTNILLNILINGGNKFPQIYFKIFREINLSDKITEYIATSKDCSMIVPEIIFIFSTPPNFKLNKKAEKVFNYQIDNVKYTNYQISNIYNPKLKFYFYIEEPEENGYTHDLRIIKV